MYINYLPYFLSKLIRILNINTFTIICQKNTFTIKHVHTKNLNAGRLPDA